MTNNYIHKIIQIQFLIIFFISILTFQVLILLAKTGNCQVCCHICINVLFWFFTKQKHAAQSIFLKSGFTSTKT